MPIRVNLLAEFHDLEEQKRRDPVKRTIMGAIAFVLIVTTYCAFRQSQILLKSRYLASLRQQWADMNEQYLQVLGMQEQMTNMAYQIERLNEFARHRFLWANTLDALQEVSIPNLAFLSINLKQDYSRTNPLFIVTNLNDTNDVIKYHWPEVVERASMILRARAFEDPGLIATFTMQVTNTPYFATNLQSGQSIRSFGAVTTVPEGDSDYGRRYFDFGKEFIFTPKTNQGPKVGVKELDANS